MSGLAIATEPGSLVQVDQQCEMVERWAAQETSIPAIRDASNRLAAIDEYLSRTSTEGRARVAASQRRLEVRIGHLLGEARETQGTRNDLSPANEKCDDGLSPNLRKDFRFMANHDDVVEEVIAESTDRRPASRARVKNEIRERHTDRTATGVAARWEVIAEMAESGHTSRQIAEALGLNPQAVRAGIVKRGIDCPADRVTIRSHHHDSDRIVAEAVASLEGVVMALALADPADLDPTNVENLASSLKTSIRSLNRFLKELTNGQE